ncbi:MAG: DTW domain-containing protein [Planctomycetota bacterium]|jgi:DTW domain-containing protein YfiP
MDPADYSKSRRCPACRLPPTLCVCDQIERVEIPFELLVIQHRSEVRSVSNTGSMAAKALDPSRLLPYQGTATPEIEDALAGDAPTLLLYPVPQAKEISPADLQPGTRLVVLDATWRQARRMYRKLHPLRGCRAVTLPPGVEPRWVLREQPAPGMLGTAEAIAAAVEALGCREEAERLRRTLDFVLPRALHTLAKITLDEALDSEKGGCAGARPDYPAEQGTDTEE